VLSRGKSKYFFFPVKWNWICPQATYMQAFAVLRKGWPRIKGVSSALPLSWGFLNYASTAMAKVRSVITWPHYVTLWSNGGGNPHIWISHICC
jgi:hypothetical protein